MSRDICIPVSAAQALAESLDLSQVIIVAWDGKVTHVVTYGGSVKDSANAAAGGNLVKRALGWPAKLDSESPKVLALEARIKELEAQVSSGGSAAEPPPVIARSAFVIEGTEYERGWGQRPDGYVAFTSEGAAKKYIKDYDKKYNNAQTVPDEFTKYKYLGLKQCSYGFYEAVTSSGAKHFSSLLEMSQ